MRQKEKRENLKREWDIRLPGGKTFDSLRAWLENMYLIKDDEFLKDAMLKELFEEIGVVSVNNSVITLYHTSESSSSVEHDLHYFLIEGFEEQKANPQPDEVIEKIKLSYKEVYEHLLDGSFSEDRTRAVLFSFLLKEKKEFIF